MWLGRMLIFFVVTGLLLFPNDSEWLGWVQAAKGWEQTGKFLGFWGDFLQFSVGWGIVLLIAAALAKDRWLRRGALAFVLAGVLSGATARVVKFSMGRARPSTVERLDLPAVTFTGPSVTSKFHGYFSGHTAAAWGSAVALAVIFPRVGWIAVLFAAGVGWSRIYGNHHFPSDVVHGAAWGTIWGCLVGSGMRRVRKRAKLMRRVE